MLTLLWMMACKGEESPGNPTEPPAPAPAPAPVPTPVPTLPADGIADFALTVDEEMVLLVHATFTDPGSSESWVEYRFEGEDWLVAPVIAPGEASILGVPAEVDVEARAAAVVDGATVYSPVVTAQTGPLPRALLAPDIAVHDVTLASPAPYAMISIATGDFTFSGPWWVEIVDRAGRVVWYQQVPDGLFSFSPTVARDGTHIWFEAEDIFGFASGEPHVTRQTLDRRWSVVLPVPELGQAIGEGPDDTFFYEYRTNSRHTVNQLDAAGASTIVWDCDAHFDAIGVDSDECSMNTTNWDPARNTVLVSQFETSTVFEVDLATGVAVRQMGQLEEGDPWTFEPADAMFAYQHFPNWTPEGTLIVSTHVPCMGAPNCSANNGQDGIQRAAEYLLDDVTKTITRIGMYESTDLWATQAGEAYRLPNGNLVVGYGQDGAVREVTPAGAVAWEAQWPRGSGGYRVVGHLSLIDDLYTLNVGR
ncbi:MAG: hypothetical protein H0V89_14020 [Deltaproteobacteria bacterium]|nr:hypothetical protein [Deltaproteobacteria bacterium]